MSSAGIRRVSRAGVGNSPALNEIETAECCHKIHPLLFLLIIFVLSLTVENRSFLSF